MPPFHPVGGKELSFFAEISLHLTRLTLLLGETETEVIQEGLEGIRVAGPELAIQCSEGGWGGGQACLDFGW